MVCILRQLISVLVTSLLAAMATAQTGVVPPSDRIEKNFEPATEIDPEPCRQAVSDFPIRLVVCTELLSHLSLQSDVPESTAAEVSSLLAVGYARTGRSAEANEVIGQLLADQPDSWIAHANHAAMLLYLSQFESALNAAERAIALSPQPIPDLYMNQALAYRGIGNFPRAQEAYRVYQNLMGLTPVEPQTKAKGQEQVGPPEAERLEQRLNGPALKPAGGIQTR